MSDTWHNRDLPVLDAAVTGVDEDQFVDDSTIVRATGLSEEDVQRALRALASDNLIKHGPVLADGSITLVTGVSGRARRAVGAWPTPETAADRMIAALEQIAANTDDEDTRSRVRKILEGLGGSGRQIAVGVGTAIITGQVT